MSKQTWRLKDVEKWWRKLSRWDKQPRKGIAVIAGVENDDLAIQNKQRKLILVWKSVTGPQHGYPSFSRRRFAGLMSHACTLRQWNVAQFEIPHTWRLYSNGNNYGKIICTSIYIYIYIIFERWLFEHMIQMNKFTFMYIQHVWKVNCSDSSTWSNQRWCPFRRKSENSTLACCGPIDVSAVSTIEAIFVYN